LISYCSQHPMSQKRGTKFSLVDRAFLLSHPEFHQKNLELVIETLLNNDYLLSLIFKVMNDRIKSLVNRKTQTERERLPQRLMKYKHPNGLLYLSNFSEKFKNIVVGTKLKLAFHSLNKLSKFIKFHKDPLLNFQKKNVVYKICCKDWDASYVRQTGRILKTRVSEHQNHIRWNISTVSVITDHKMHFNHDFDWNNVEILDVGDIITNNWFPRCSISNAREVDLIYRYRMFGSRVRQ